MDVGNIVGVLVGGLLTGIGSAIATWYAHRRDDKMRAHAERREDEQRRRDDARREVDLRRAVYEAIVTLARRVVFATRAEDFVEAARAVPEAGSRLDLYGSQSVTDAYGSFATAVGVHAPHLLKDGAEHDTARGAMKKRYAELVCAVRDDNELASRALDGSNATALPEPGTRALGDGRGDHGP